MLSKIRLAFVISTLSAACSSGIPTDRRAAPAYDVKMPASPDGAGLGIEVTQARSDEAILRLKLPASWSFGTRVTWFRNGERYVFPAPPTDATEDAHAIPLNIPLTVTTALPPDDLSDPFKDESVAETWAVEAVPYTWLGEGEPVRTEVNVKLSRGCEVYHPGWVYVGCRRNVVFSVPLTEAVELGATAPALYLEQFVERHFLARPGTAGHDRFRAFINLVGFSALATTDVTLVAHNPETYLVAPSVTLPADEMHIMDRTCLDIPLVGSVCLHSYAWDIDHEPGALVLDFGPEAEAIAMLRSPPPATDTTIAPSDYGSFEIRHVSGNRYDLTLRLHRATADLLFEPPADPTLTDLKNDSGSPYYHPEQDLSNYVKAYGQAQLGTPLEAVFSVEMPVSETNRLDFTLVSVRVNKVDFQLVFRKGPYCNSNLGTTETPTAGSTHSADDALRPFDANGVPMFSGLVSDTTSGLQGGGAHDVLRTFYGKLSFPYPHGGSSPNGGSGAGRDRIGFGAAPYEYDVEGGRYSDNPNNCLRPADACSIAGLQDGGPEWLGVTNGSMCESPNVSNNSDDATYKVSEQITSIVPYLQGEIQWVLLNGDHRRR